MESFCGLIPAFRIVTVGVGDAPTAKAEALKKMNAISMLDDHPDNANAASQSVAKSVLLNCNYSELTETIPEVSVIDDPMDYPVIVEDLLRRIRRA